MNSEAKQRIIESLGALMLAVELMGVRFRYRGGADDALKGVDFAASRGERVAVVGLTGAGKSTLLKCMNRLVPASYKGDFQGAVRVLGEDVSGARPAELSRTVGIVFQDFDSQLFSTTAELDVAFGPENLGLETDEIKQRVAESLKAVGLDGFRSRDPATLSGGQKQRLAMATVLSLSPTILCLDEPVTDLDPEARTEVAQMVAELCQKGFTVILAEHEPDLLWHADRIAGLDSGAKVVDQRADEALWDPERLSSLGVRPPDLVRVFNGLGISEKPVDVKEAADILRQKGIELDGTAFTGREEKEPGQEIIRAEGLVHSYPDGIEALKGVDIQIRAGEFVAVLGRNGSGKTTLVKHLNGLLKPTSGAVSIENKDTRETGVSELGRRVGFVFQDPDHQIFAARVFDEAAFAPRNFGFSDSEVEERVVKALKMVGLVGCEDQDPFMLTKGFRQRVAIASVLAAEPGIIVLDEPTTGLDYPAQKAVMDLLKDLNQEGRTVIVITHTVWVAAEYAARCILMDHGKVLGDGPARSVLSDEELLSKAGLTMPPVTAFAKEMGASVLTVEEFLSAARRRA